MDFKCLLLSLELASSHQTSNNIFFFHRNTLFLYWKFQFLGNSGPIFPNFGKTIFFQIWLYFFFLIRLPNCMYIIMKIHSFTKDFKIEYRENSTKIWNFTNLGTLFNPGALAQIWPIWANICSICLRIHEINKFFPDKE